MSNKKNVVTMRSMANVPCKNRFMPYMNVARAQSCEGIIPLGRTVMAFKSMNAPRNRSEKPKIFLVLNTKYERLLVSIEALIDSIEKYTESMATMVKKDMVIKNFE